MVEPRLAPRLSAAARPKNRFRHLTRHGGSWRFQLRIPADLDPADAFKKNPGHRGGNCREQRHATRTLVPRRRPHRSEEQGHATLGGTRHATFCLEGSANRLGLYLRRDLSRARQGGRPPATVLQPEAMTLHLQEIALMPFCSWIGPDGMSQRSWACPKTSRSSRCRPSRPNSIPSRTSGDTCVITGSNGIFANYEDILGHCCINWNNWSNARGSSCRSKRGDGRMGGIFSDLALDQSIQAKLVTKEAPKTNSLKRRRRIAGWNPNLRRAANLTALIPTRNPESKSFSLDKIT